MHLGCNIYYWGDREQNRLLHHCLGPLAARLEAQHLCERFWFGRFDARGPHVFALFVVPEPAIRMELVREVSATLARYLADCPSGVTLSATELEARHLACRGKTLCAADHPSEPASNNTFVLCDHGPRDYPFSLSEELPDEERFWQHIEELSFWTIRQLGAGGQATAATVRWVAAIDGVLQARDEAADYWRFHAGTLLPGLAERLRASEAPEEVLRGLVGERNMQIFLQLWQRPPSSDLPDPSRWVEIIDADRRRTREQRQWLLREVVHTTLQQLGVPVSQQIPLVLFAACRDKTPGPLGGARE